MDFIAVGEAELAGAQNFAVTLNHELGLAVQDQKDLRAQIVAVRDVLLARLHLEKPRADVGLDDQVLDVGA